MNLFFKLCPDLLESGFPGAVLSRFFFNAVAAMVFAAFFGSGVVVAQSVQVLGEFRDWSAYSANDGGGPICFAMTRSKETKPEPEGYTGGFIYITHRPSQNLRNEFNMIAGYEFAVESVAIATVGSNVYELFTSADGAWLMDPKQGEVFARDLRAGVNLVIEGESAGGEDIIQTFSLSGATASSRAINSACL